MSDKRDYYEVIGVSRDAGDDEIRRAYRKLALKYHPDRNQGDEASEAKFKEATEAFSVLSDSNKRSTYDRFGHAGLSGGGADFSGAGMGDIFSQFQDMFSDFFGGGAGGGQRRRGERGRDVRVEVTITLADAMEGLKREVAVQGEAPCDDCKGSGAATANARQACVQCGGTGQVRTQRGFIMFSTHCPRCQGQGQIITDPCKTCDGQGATLKTRRVTVNFPVGIDGGQRLRVPGQGMPGPNGSPAGDLYVDVELEADERFERDGSDLVVRQTLSFADATLGTECTLTLPNDEQISLNIPEGTQPGTVITVRDKGMPALSGRGPRGSLHVVTSVDVPKKLSKKARKLLNELAEELRG